VRPSARHGWALAHRSPRRRALIADLRQFTGAAWEQEDDITLVALPCFALC
jgi:hypothetical protein